MNWYCFKFWLSWRFVMAALAHFNWFTALYVGCLYFSLWKSYDLLWFWSHLVLCICFKPLRSENFLLVVCNLLMEKRKRYKNKTYKKIYNLLYNQRFTKSERALRRIETIEGRKRARSTNANGDQNLPEEDEDDVISSADEADYDAAYCSGSESEANEVDRNKLAESQHFKSTLDFPSGKSLVENEAKPIHSRINELSSSKLEIQQAMPNIRVDRRATSRHSNGETTEAKIPLVNVGPTPTTIENDVPSETSTSSSAARRFINSLPRRIVPRFIQSVVSSEAGSIAGSMEPAEKALIAREKQRLKDEKRQQKERQAQRKVELRQRAKLERRRRNVAAAIDLLLTWLRLMTSFAILVGNIHKTFMPNYLVSPGDDFYDKPDLLMLFTITLSLDVLLFWMMMFWTYCQQCRLCCRLGLFRFWMWLVMLGFLGGICMFLPMHYIHEQLDLRWCSLMPGSDLNEYFGRTETEDGD